MYFIPVLPRWADNWMKRNFVFKVMWRPTAKKGYKTFNVLKLDQKMSALNWMESSQAWGSVCTSTLDQCRLYNKVVKANVHIWNLKYGFKDSDSDKEIIKPVSELLCNYQLRRINTISREQYWFRNDTGCSNCCIFGKRSFRLGRFAQCVCETLTLQGNNI